MCTLTHEGREGEASTGSAAPSKDLPIGREKRARGLKSFEKSPVNQARKIVERSITEQCRVINNRPVMLTTSKQIAAYPRITSPRGVLSCHDEAGFIPRSPVPNIILGLSLPSVTAYTIPTPPPLTCQVRDAVPVIRWRETP